MLVAAVRGDALQVYAKAIEKNLSGCGSTLDSTADAIRLATAELQSYGKARERLLMLVLKGRGSMPTAAGMGRLGRDDVEAGARDFAYGLARTFMASLGVAHAVWSEVRCAASAVQEERGGRAG